jgi:hypothetical protein
MVIKIEKGEFVMTKTGLVSFSSKNLTVFKGEPDFKDTFEVPVGTALEYDVEKAFKELGLNYLDYFGYSFSFNAGVDVYGEYEGTKIKPITSGAYKDFTKFVLFVCSNADGDKLEFAPITDWKKASPTPPPAPAAPAKKDGESVNDAIVTIVYDYEKHKLRAKANDGVHGVAWCQFPNPLRNREGQKYRVDRIEWDYGKGFYRCKGNIRPIY